ncbi:hypothetical protein NMG60_11002983 [Bertholletia excelsa]
MITGRYKSLLVKPRARGFTHLHAAKQRVPRADVGVEKITRSEGCGGSEGQRRQTRIEVAATRDEKNYSCASAKIEKRRPLGRAAMEEQKGTVTSLSSLFPAEEAQKASQRVHDAIVQRQKELDQLRGFIDDNTNLINLVQKLPNELHHDIMVPFGKAAFFPGRLIHTNEFLVLLGEGYYAERTSKQTSEILKRRGKALESQVQSLKGVMQDLEAEASFFDATAAESAEGLVEIREKYIEEPSAGRVSKAGLTKLDPCNFSESENKQALVEDEEYARIMSRIDELEKEELAEENAKDSDEDDEYGTMMSRVDELEKLELAAESLSEHSDNESRKTDPGHFISEHTLDCTQRISGDHQRRKEMNQSMEAKTVSRELPKKHISQQDSSSQREDLKVQSLPEDDSSSTENSAFNKYSSAEKTCVLPEVKENVQAKPQSTNMKRVDSNGNNGNRVSLNWYDCGEGCSMLQLPTKCDFGKLKLFTRKIFTRLQIYHSSVLLLLHGSLFLSASTPQFIFYNSQSHVVISTSFMAKEHCCLDCPHDNTCWLHCHHHHPLEEEVNSSTYKMGC